MKHIAITKQVIDGIEVNSISGRELHKTLEVKKAFTTWITAALDTMGSIQGEDYVKLKTSLSGSGYQWDYMITLDLGKHIAMMSKVPMGKEIREYFIKVEKQHSEKQLVELGDHKHKIQALLEYTDKMGDVVTEHDKRIQTLEKNVRMESWMERNLMDAKNSKVYELAGDDKKLANSLHRKVWQLFKKRFHLPRYNELKFGQYEAGLEYIHGLTLSDMVG